MPSKVVDRVLPSPCPPSREPGTILVETERIIIRRHLLTDAPAIALAANHEEVANCMSDRFPSPYTVADAEQNIQEKAIQLSSQNDGTNVYPHWNAILIKPGCPGNPSASEPLLVGGVGVRALTDILYRTWEMGYFLTPSVWRQGYATEALIAFTRWAFETWPKLNRIQAQAYGNNAASQKLLQKCGFVYEGTGRGVFEKNGVVLDEVRFGLLRSDLK